MKGKKKSFLVSEKTEAIMARIYPEKNLKDECRRFKREKIKKCLFIFGVSVIFAVIIEVVDLSSNELKKNEFIERNDYGKGDKKVSLYVERKDNLKGEKIDIEVKERDLSKEELEELYTRFDGYLDKAILGKNNNIDQIIYSMNLSNKYDGFPFSVRWSSSKPLILSGKGIVDMNRLKSVEGYEEGIVVKLVSEISYKTFIREKEYLVRVYPQMEKKTFSELFEEALKKASEDTITESRMYLPKEIESIPVRYREVKDNRAVIALVIGVIGIFYVSANMDQKMKEKEIERNEEMLKDYPKILNKYALYYVAGMSSKRIWDKICNDYIKEVENGGKMHYAYEEMILARRGMKDGMGEIYCYEMFAKRCNLARYRTFINIVEQAIKKGRDDMSSLLEKEINDSFIERKNQAKILGEKAGTKLLAPMFMMLLVVIIMIIMPAYMAFGI